MNKKQLVGIVIALVLAAGLWKACAQTPNGTALSGRIETGYQNSVIDRGQVVAPEGDSTYLNALIAAPVGKSLDGYFATRYSGFTGGDHLNLSSGVGTALFKQYLNLEITKRINSSLEAYQADLSIRLQELPVPVINKLFTPVVTLSKTWDSNNKGIQLGGDRLDKFAIFGRDFTLQTAAVYGSFDNYDFAKVTADISTQLIGKVDLNAGVGYLKHLSGPNDGEDTTPVFAGLRMKF